MKRFRLITRLAPGRATIASLGLSVTVTLALGAAIGNDRAKAGDQNLKLAELTKGSMRSLSDAQPRPRRDSAEVAREASPGVQFVREIEGEFAPRDIEGVPGQPAPLSLKLSPVKAGESSLLTFRGLPEAVKLSSGFRFQDAWAVSPADAASLLLLPDPGYEGSFTLEISVMKKNDGAPDRQAVRVDISRRSKGGRAPSSRVVGAGEPTGGESLIAPAIGLTPSARPQIPATEEAAMMERASSLLRTGDIAAARLLYERLAKRGSQQGALALARTFDPDTLRALGAVGLKPDVGKAKEWYRKAADLGSREAGSRLTALMAVWP